MGGLGRGVGGWTRTAHQASYLFFQLFCCVNFLALRHVYTRLSAHYFIVNLYSRTKTVRQLNSS